jgi:hypothetical protein
MKKVCLTNTKIGTIHIAEDVTTARAIYRKEMKTKHHPIFLAAELPHLKGRPDRLLQILADVKMVFPGSVVEKVENITVEGTIEGPEAHQEEMF